MGVRGAHCIWILHTMLKLSYGFIAIMSRLLFHERIKARCVIVNALGAMVVIILLKAGEIGQVRAAVPYGMADPNHLVLEGRR